MKAFVEEGNEYVTQAWRAALAPLGVAVEHSLDPASEYVVKYQDYDTYDFDTRGERTRWVYSYVYRKALTRKNYLGNTVLQYRAKRPQSVLHKAWPDSFNLELDYPEFLDDALDENWDLKQELATNKTWILKPALGERADGIRIFKGQDELQAVFDDEMGSDEEDDAGNAAQMRQYVVQEYVTNPLLIGGRKFHLRVYVLCVGRLAVYVNPRMLALFSSAPYNADMSDLRAHLTNTCFQGPDAKVSLLEDELPEKARAVTDEVCAVVRDLFAAAESDPINFQSLPEAFEFFGLDFLVTEDLSVRLLEVNAYPDFKQTGARLRPVVDDMFAETAALLVAGTEPRLLRKVYERDSN